VNIHNKNKRIEKLSCGANHSTFLINGKVFCRGEPEASTTGRRVSKRRTVENSLTFNGVNIGNVVDVECGGYHTVAKTNRHGKVQYYAWGTNNHGQLGIGTFESQSFPTEIRKLRNKNICQIAAGGSFTLFLSAEGELFGCGSNEDSNLGLGSDFEYNDSEEENQSHESDGCAV
jgi:alpha-tubulin suppressor-like RCC1 family protein